MVSDWANALGMAGGQAAHDDITAVDYWATGTVRLNGSPCALTNYHVSVNYQVPSMRQEFSCVDANGKAHHEIHGVAGRLAWNEIESGDRSAAMGALDERLVQLWSGPLALVKAATTAGAATKVSAERGATVVTLPVPGVSGATVKATLNDRNQAAKVEAQFGATTIHTVYSDYVDLDGSDLRFYTFFPRHIVQEQGGVTLVDLTVTDVLGPDSGTAGAATLRAEAAPAPPNVVYGVPSTWKDKKSFGKLDQSLRQVIARGCDGPQSVIIRAKTGYRGGLRDSLKAHGSRLNGEFASINAVGANVSCSDLQTLAGFDSTLSVSVNAPVFSSQASLGDITPPAVPPDPPVDAPVAPPVDVPPAPPADPPPAAPNSAADARDGGQQ